MTIFAPHFSPKMSFKIWPLPFRPGSNVKTLKWRKSSRKTSKIFVLRTKFFQSDKRRFLPLFRSFFPLLHRNIAPWTRHVYLRDKKLKHDFIAGTRACIFVQVGSVQADLQVGSTSVLILIFIMGRHTSGYPVPRRPESALVFWTWADLEDLVKIARLMNKPTGGGPIHHAIAAVSIFSGMGSIYWSDWKLGWRTCFIWKSVKCLCEVTSREKC